MLRIAAKILMSPSIGPSNLLLKVLATVNFSSNMTLLILRDLAVSTFSTLSSMKITSSGPNLISSRIKVWLTYTSVTRSEDSIKNRPIC